MGKDDLIQTYGISGRLAVRVGALLAQGLAVSSTLLEIAGAGSAIEKLLLHADLLKKADGLSTKELRRLATETGADTEGPLVVAEGPEGRVIALEEELAAEEGFAQTAETGKTIARVQPGAEPAKILDDAERRGLFNRQEIARLKLEALAGKDIEARISALRKLMFAPISAQEKGGICLRALLDASSAVRGEAVKAIESLGFNRDTADAIRRVLEGDDRTRHAALRRLADLVGKLQPGEQRVVLAVLVEVFRESRIKGPHDPLVHLLFEIIPLLGAHGEIVPEFARVAVQHILAEPTRLGTTLRDFLSELACHSPRSVCERLWAEVETVRDVAPRALLLGLLIEIEKDEAGVERLSDVIAEELLREDVDEVTRQKLGHNFVALDKPAAEGLLRRYGPASNTQRAALTSFLDILACDRKIDDGLRNRIAEQLGAALPGADRRLRAEILRSRVFTLPQIEEPLKIRLARELIALLRSDFSGAETADRAVALMEMMGEPAAHSLLDFLKGRPSAELADAAARVLGRILGRSGLSRKTADLRRPAVSLLMNRMGGRRKAPGGYPVALAQILSGAQMKEESRDALDLMFRRFARFERLSDLIEAVASLAADAPVRPEQRVKAAGLFSELLERSASEDETQMREVEVEGGKLYEITGQVEFDSEILPAAVKGLARIALSARTTPALQERIIRQLLQVWTDVRSWKLVWGPRSSQVLAEALGEIGSAETLDNALRAEILHALGAGMDRLSAVRAMRTVFSCPDVDSQVNNLISTIATQILDHWIQPDISADELQEVLAAVTEAAARKRLPATRAAGRQLQDRTVQLLLDAMRAGHDWHRPMLERLRDCGAISRDLRKQIEGALAKTGLVKISRKARWQRPRRRIDEKTFF